MKPYLLVLALVALIFSPGDAAEPTSLDSLSWLEGDWVRQTKRGEATERWTRVSKNTMEGVGFVTSGDSIHVSEYLRLERFGEEIFFTAKPRQNPYPTSFLMTEYAETRIVFENPDHDFPQRIIYTRSGDNGLVARVEGLMDGEMGAIDFNFERKK